MGSKAARRGRGRLKASFRVVASSLADRRIRWVLVAFTLFSVAEWVRWVGLLVYGFEEAGAAGAGLIAVIQLVPGALVIPFASGLADRFDRTWVLVVSYLIAAIGTGGAGIAIAVDASFAVVSVLAAVGLAGFTMIRPTQSALLPQLVRTPEELTAANVTSDFIMSGSLFVGPAIASAVLAASGATAVVLVGGAMLLAGGFCMAVVRPRDRSTLETSERVDLLGGFREIRKNHAAAWILGVFVLQMVVWGAVDVLTVTLAIDGLGLDASAVGLLSASLGIGALVGGATTITLVGGRRLAPALAFGIVLWGVPMLALGFAERAPVVLVLLAAVGVGTSFFAVASRTLLQRVVDEDVLGRVFGLIEAGYLGAWAIGSAIAPVVLAAVGLGWVFVILGAAVPLFALVAWPSIARADRDATVPLREIAILRGIEMFGLLPEPTLERLAGTITPVSVPAGALIIREGDPGDLFYVVDEGEVRVTIAGSEVTRYGPGEYFGEIALLRDVPRQATVAAVTDSKLHALDRVHFLTALTGSTSAATVAHREIERRLEATPATDEGTGDSR